MACTVGRWTVALTQQKHTHADKQKNTELHRTNARAQRRTWLYRIRPSVTHEPFHPLNFPAEKLTADFSAGVVTPNQLRWRPFAIPSEPSVDFVRGLLTVCGAGSAAAKTGFAIHVYAATASMADACLANADGEMLIVPQQGAARCRGCWLLFICAAVVFVWLTAFGVVVV
jgi:homogentisate 1,2-dioxygenase